MFTPLLRAQDFTVGIWKCRGHGSGWSALERVHRPEVVVPLTGAYVRELQHREIVASPNVALFAGPGDAYRIRHPQGAPLDRCAVLLLRDDGAVDELVAAAGGRGRGQAHRGLPSGAVPLSPEAFLWVRRLVGAAGSPGERPRAEEAVSLLLLDLVGVAPGTHRDRGRRRSVLRALEYVSVHYRREVSLGEVAKVAGYSRFHFARIFREEVGMPVYRYVHRLRLREALHAVDEGAEDLSRLALSLGFSSHSHFTAAFHRAFGRTPSTVRAEGQRWTSARWRRTTARAPEGRPTTSNPAAT